MLVSSRYTVRVLPQVAIVVPVLNEAASVPALAQRLRGLSVHETLLVDGGSSDGTAQQLQAAGLTVCTSPRGRAQQMNAGAQHTQSGVLLFLHADTALTASHVRCAQESVQDGADFGCFTLRLDSLDPRLCLVAQLISLRSRLIVSATGDQAIFIRRTLFEALGGYREIALCEDLDLVQRARGRGHFVCIDRPVQTSARRWQQRGILRTILLMWALRLGCHAGIDPAALRRLYEDAR